MSFNKLKVKELKSIIATYKKQHCLSNYSKLRKADLIKVLEAKFDIKDGKLLLKSISQTETKQKKRITPQLISKPVENNKISKTTSLTKGQQTYEDTVNLINNKAKSKANYLNDKSFAQKIRGKN
jgi:hypothetical protein